ncbi:MAG TPA: glycosyltransferase family 39 protein [Chloroflexota bacterium]|nr:glycosyltransferase family 39 protein [Chloroflexota bacterium]
MSTKNLFRLSLLAVFLLAFGLRFHLLDAQSFWNDEGNSARLSERTITLIIEGTASDIHPPLYYLLLHGWRQVAGTTEFGLRAFSALAGVLLVAAVAAFSRIVRPRDCWRGGMVLVAALLTAVNPALIYYSQETRMYALLGLLAVLSAWALWQWWAALGQVRWAWGAAYVLLAAAGLYTHYFFPAVLVAQNLVVLVWLVVLGRGVGWATAVRRLLLPWTGMMLAVLLLYAPWLPIFAGQFGADDLGQRGSFVAFVVTAVSWMTFGSTIAVETVRWAVVMVVLMLGVGVWLGRRWVWGTAVCLLIPLLFMYAAGTVQPEYLKFLLVAVPFQCVLLATAVTTARPKSLRLALPILLIGALTLGTLSSLRNLYTNPTYARADYRNMAARILADNHPDAGIILNAPNQWEVFTYYYPDDTAVYPLPEGRSHPTPEAIDTALAAITAQHDRLYAIFWGDAQRDPERLIERWLDAHAFKARDEWVGDVRFVVYAVPPAPATTMDTAVAIPFGDSITLEGYTVKGTALQPGDILQVTLFWQTAVPLDQRYKVFLHLIGPNGRLVTQRDSEPGGGLNLTTIWQPGETVIDNHGLLLPADLPPGPYTLLLGLYDIADPTARLPVLTSTGETDTLPMAEITVH